MLLEFNIEYYTEWGEEIKLCGSAPEIGASDENKAIALRTSDGKHWQVTVEVPFTESINYYYFVSKNGETLRREWNMPFRCLHFSGNVMKKYRIYDSWRDIPRQSYYFSSAFTRVFLNGQSHSNERKAGHRLLLFHVYCAGLDNEHTVAISGNQEIVGNWDERKVLLFEKNHFEYDLELDVSELAFPFEYKFVLYNLKNKKVEKWEEGPNRFICNPEILPDESVIQSALSVHFELPLWKGAGVAIPVFSLRSEESFGVGDFSDLKKMVDWAVLTGQQVVQLLPVNDTTLTHTRKDSYPYHSISIYALHPIYLNLGDLGILSDQLKQNCFEQERKRLNALATMDYEEVSRLKWDYIKTLYEQEGSRVLSSGAFKLFFEENQEWLIPYAAYSYLRDVYKTPDFRLWPRYSVYDVAEIRRICSPESMDYPNIAIYYYIQYYLHRQLLEASGYARSRGVVLKGDIPIGISRNSVEAWIAPRYFNFDGQTGAPPDEFSVNGQNWGFPTYNWEEMERDGYSWWVGRFRKMSRYFDAYRIDHILGFFRIWEIPLHAVHGLLGQFVPSLPMSKDEIEHYGFSFDEQLFLEPCIHESFLPDIFGTDMNFVISTFLELKNSHGDYRMRRGFQTQREVESYFKDKTDIRSISLREGLYKLISNVLFIADRYDPETYHPRIGVRNDFIYQTLSEPEKEAFDRLYDHYYYHRHNQFWYEQAMKKLPALIGSNPMLACGEDLGMIPGCVPQVMNELRILSLEIERMPKNPGDEFGRPENNPYCSVCTISTHDMSTLRGWWKEDLPKIRRYYHEVLGRNGRPPQEADGEICEEIVRRNLGSSSMFAILSFQDWLSLDEKWRNSDIDSERINIPADPNHYWCYRMHVTLESLLNAKELNDKISDLIDRSGRNPKK